MICSYPISKFQISFSNNGIIGVTHQKHDVSGSDILSQRTLCPAVNVLVIIQGIISRIVASLSRCCCTVTVNVYVVCVYVVPLFITWPSSSVQSARNAGIITCLNFLRARTLAICSSLSAFLLFLCSRDQVTKS